MLQRKTPCSRHRLQGRCQIKNDLNWLIHLWLNVWLSTLCQYHVTKLFLFNHTAEVAEDLKDLTPQCPGVHKKVRLIPSLLVNLAPPASQPEIGLKSPPSAPLRLLSVDEVSDCTSFTGSSDPPSPSQAKHVTPRLDKKRRRRAGLRALRFIKQNSFSQHAVFCLLTGRPLVVIGGDESLVRKLVDALSLFLPAPGPDGSAVMPCLTTPLQLTDVLTWRLVGIHR